MSYTGVLHLSVKKRQQKTVLGDCYYEGTMKITRPVYLEENEPTLYCIHVGGGYVDGDRYKTSIHLTEAAAVSVTTQSSTKIYRTPTDCVKQETIINLARNSVLEYFPDPIIAYEEAKFFQNTVVHMEEGACYFASDIITPGWAEDGSFFKYAWIRSKQKIYRNNKLIFFDHLCLEPGEDFTSIMQMEGYTHIGTLLLIHDQADRTFRLELDQLVENYQEGIRFGISKLPVNGFILRILAYNTGIIERIFHSVHALARKSLLGKEALEWRKY
ncbi:urease accessory protein UreD [Niallia sp.]|uniref:urease accessory protein UreD n=1 Tax=Niallia sp. TaxID=2837523 RepID=UPI002899A43C|nr:urease accessory protein UreD [Niallia sp.]